MMAYVHKTDKLDSDCLATLLYLAELTYGVFKKSEPYREPPHWAHGGRKSPASSARGRHAPNIGPTETRELIVPPLANVIMPL